MKPNEILNDINRLGISEKIILVEDIWDSIAQSNAILPMPEWQKIELEKRYGEYKAGKMSLHDWNDVHENLRNMHK